jgi:type II secretory ATPase GspE/PulE/Tfp pilus assembly ATPase PilB-like protein
MVGEIRDNDTAKTALQASLTGHLVLATFHASSASAALTRLSDIIGQNPLFVSAIRLVMAQRLIRQLDDATKQPYQATQAELDVIHNVFATFPEGTHLPDTSNLTLYKPGASTDNPFGYQGQIAVREQFQMNGPIRSLLETHDHVLSAQEIEAAAIQSGMQTMLQDAILQVVAGHTTLDEVFRVLG